VPDQPLPDQPTLDESHLTSGTTSPFLSGTKVQFAWDSTSLGYLKTCPRLYQYTILDGWSSRHESVHLRFGGEYASALEHFNHLRAEGGHYEDCVRSCVAKLLSSTSDWIVDEDTKAGKYKNRDSLVGLVVDYLDHFRDDPCQTYILDSGKPAVELSFRFELDWGPTYRRTEFIAELGSEAEISDESIPYLLCGHLDRVVTFNDQLFVMDQKTTSTTLGDRYFDQYEPHNQMTLYTLAGQVILNAPVKGVIIDAAQIMLEKPNRFVRGFTYRTQDQLDEWLLDLRFWLNIAESYADSGYWPMNDTACDKFGGCRFREVCSKSPEVRDQFLRADFIQLEEDDRWNPLRSR